MADKGPRVGLGTKLVYGLGSVAFGTKDNGFGYFLLIFYNQVVGVSASLVGLALMIAVIADAVFDPIIGQISDNWRSRLGRRHPFMYGAAIPVAGFYFLLWDPPAWSSAALFWYVLVIAVLVRIAIACYEIPSNALAPELTTDYDERTSLMAYRWLFGALGNGLTFFVALTFFMVATKAQPTGMLNRGGYFHYGIMAAIVMAVSILLSAAGTHSRIGQLRKAIPRPRATVLQILREMFQTLFHGSFLMITIATLFTGMAIGLAGVLNSYLVTYFWKFTTQQAAALGFGALVAAFLGFGIAPTVSAVFGKKTGFMVTAFVQLVILNSTIVLKLLGLLPPDGSYALLAIFFFSFAIGLGLALCAGILASSMIADVVEDSEVRTGRRSEGLFFSSLSFAQKAISGLGVFLAGNLLDFVHFPKHASPTTINPHIVRNLIYVYVPFHLALWVIAFLFIGAYRIDRGKHEHNLKSLAEAAATAEAAEEGVAIP